MHKTAVSIFTLLPMCVLAQVTEGTSTALTGANTLFGPTGLILVPTAYTVAERELAISASFGEGIRGPAINYGAARYIEIGGAFIDRDSSSNKVIGNAKITILPQNFKNFEIGIGVIDIADAISQTIFVMGSVDLVPPTIVNPGNPNEMPVGFKAHVGFGSGMFSEELIGGAELLFGNKISIIGEWDSNNFNGAVRWSPNDTTRVQLGFTHQDFFFGLTSKVRM